MRRGKNPSDVLLRCALPVQRYPLLNGIGRALIIVLILALLSIPISFTTPIFAQTTTSVTAEAIGQANLRAATDTAAELLGEIRAGTRYPVIGRSALYPWVLLADPTSGQPIGWVFNDLVTVQGAISTVPFTEIMVTGSGIVQPAPSVSPIIDAAASTTPAAVSGNQTSPTSNVIGTVQGEINIRYGPGVEYPRIGVGRVGESFSIITWHTQLPWVQIRYEQSPTGAAWVAIDLLDIQGDLYSLPSVSQTIFNYPTLTPTPANFEEASVLGATPVPLSPEFQALSGQLWQMMLDASFDPATSRLGSFFLMDLQTGESISFESEIAFSGMSVNKIAILTALYDWLLSPPDDARAYTIAEAMICSENISTNEVLSIIGEGNPYTGAERVSAFLERVGLERTFIYTPYANDPFITPQSPRTRITSADQVSAEPDPFNQMTVNEIGGLLNSVYQCGYNERSPLLDTGTFTQTECRQILHVMGGNRIGNLIEAGVPADVRVAHKHGWIDDTHGDAAVVFSPGGAYILVIVLHNPVWLNFDESSTLVAEMSRTVYNYFNPNATMQEVRYEEVPAQCELLGNPIISDLRDPNFGG
jgi:uncharacterized protein YraI/beta-lactamase class A